LGARWREAGKHSGYVPRSGAAVFADGEGRI
jgi:hypothetical protein